MHKLRKNRLEDIFCADKVIGAREKVDHLFAAAPDRGHKIREYPIIGGSWVAGEDPVGAQKESVARALLARDWFKEHGPADLAPLPLGYDEREKMKRGASGLPFILAYYTRSLAGLDYDVTLHPSFEKFARGVMASHNRLPWIHGDSFLQARFPAKPLEGLDGSFCWNPPDAPVNGRRRSKAA
jgi:hypothetical protein